MRDLTEEMIMFCIIPLHEGWAHELTSGTEKVPGTYVGPFSSTGKAFRLAASPSLPLFFVSVHMYSSVCWPLFDFATTAELRPINSSIAEAERIFGKPAVKEKTERMARTNLCMRSNRVASRFNLELPPITSPWENDGPGPIRAATKRKESRGGGRSQRSKRSKGPIPAVPLQAMAPGQTPSGASASASADVVSVASAGADANPITVPSDEEGSGESECVRILPGLAWDIPGLGVDSALAEWGSLVGESARVLANNLTAGELSEMVRILGWQVTGDALCERGGFDAATAHSERIRLDWLQAEATEAISGAAAARDKAKHTESARAEAEIALSNARSELSREHEGAGKLADQLRKVKAALTERDEELRHNSKELETIKRALPPPTGSTVGEKLRWVEKAAKFVGKATVGYGMWCSGATPRFLSLLLRSKNCMHIGPSMCSSPDEVNAIFYGGSGAGSSRRDADDFATKIWPAMGHDAAVAAMSSVSGSSGKDASSKGKDAPAAKDV
uniref:Uncharacterized protein n=1 Tax=Leersia perrieri TaxID=77586 RepID=A0A0D9WQR7_9ORYZ